MRFPRRNETGPLAARDSRFVVAMLKKRRKKEAPAPGKLRQHQPRQPVVNNAHRPAAAASGTPPAPASRADGLAQEKPAGRQQSAPGRCCGSRPKRRPTQPNAVRPPAVTVSVCDCSRGAGGEPVLVRLTAGDLNLPTLRRRCGSLALSPLPLILPLKIWKVLVWNRLASAVRITDETRLQCLAGGQWLTVLSGQDQLLLDVVSENGGDTLALRLQAEAPLQDPALAAEPQPEPPPKPTQRVTGVSGGDSVAGSEPHRMTVDHANAPARAVYTASDSAVLSEQLSSHAVATDHDDATRSRDVVFPLRSESHRQRDTRIDREGQRETERAESHSAEWLSAPSAKASPAASGISWVPRLEQTFDTARDVSRQTEGKDSISAVDTSALHAVRELSARLGQVEAALQERHTETQRQTETDRQSDRESSLPRANRARSARPISPQFPLDDSYRDEATQRHRETQRDEASQRLAGLSLRAAQVQDELRSARSQRWSTPNSSMPRPRERDSDSHRDTQRGTETWRETERAEGFPRVASPQFPHGEDSYRDEQATERLTDLSGKAAQVQDELRRAREAKPAVGALPHSPTSSSTLPRADRRSPDSISPQFFSGEESYRDEQASQRLADLTARAAHVQDELRRAREARLAAFGGHGRGSEVAHGHTGAAAAVVPQFVATTGRRDPAVARTHAPVAIDPRDIAQAQLANLREGFSQLLREGTAKRMASVTPGSAPGRAPKRPQIFDPKSPRGASFGAARQARFPNDARSGAEHRSIRRGSPTYDWTFE